MKITGDLDVGSLSDLLDEVRGELESAVTSLERTRSAHRKVETVLLAVLDHVPAPIVVIDRELRVRAASAAAEHRWDAKLDALLSGATPLHPVAAPVRDGLEHGAIPAGSMPAGFGASVVDEPGTDDRYVVVWAAQHEG